jgi:cyclopropane-fatty-acyl-phospholipid synthase
MSIFIKLAEQALIPDAWIRWGIRRLDRLRLATEGKGDVEALSQAKRGFIGHLRGSPIALQTDKPREQHYEVPPEFFQKVLGRHMKYSSCYWPQGVENLDMAEAAMLDLYCQRAEIKDGIEILDLGCGWGSLTFWIAEHYPNATVLAVSNAQNQIDFIRATASDKGFDNIQTMMVDMNHMETTRRFDRVLSIEMFEHMRNWENLLRKISTWLKPQGKCFIHIFTHKKFAYLFETEGARNWMGRYFFTAGMMPSDDLMLYFQDSLRLEDHWTMSGEHYKKTAEAWLSNLDGHRDDVLAVLAGVYGRSQAKRWFQRWRIFFMACAELWGYEKGQEWLVSHYRVKKP